MKRASIFTGLLFLLTAAAAAQTTLPFWDEVGAFKKMDSVHQPPKNAILFVGSSSFRKWTDVSSYFPHYTIINRGFGGSSLPDVIRYEDDLIYPYHPKQVLIYCGDNDLAASDTVSAQTVYGRFVQLFTDVRKHLPNASIVFVSIKPSPSRAQLMPKMAAANGLIKKFLADKRNTAYVDVYNKMLQADGRPIGSLFLEDSLHMNSKGYAIWQKQILPVLRR